MFRKIGAVILLVSNMDSSVDFYQNTLGLELKNRSKEWTEFIKNGTVLALNQTKIKNIMKDGVLIGFKVGNLDDVCIKLKKKNVKFVQEPIEEEYGKNAIIRDPDGYMISIIEMKLSEEEEMKQTPGFYGFAPA
ncbi:MAG: VOC family protein [Nitrososphaerales archaeon]